MSHWGICSQRGLRRPRRPFAASGRARIRELLWPIQHIQHTDRAGVFSAATDPAGGPGVEARGIRHPARVANTDESVLRGQVAQLEEHGVLTRGDARNGV
jgi:hypothetical protein